LTPDGGAITSLINQLLSRPPAEPVYALIKDSDNWGAVRVEGQVYFPTDGDAYLGIVHGYQVDHQRADFGSIYVIDKKKRRYVRVNPHYDWNPARALYEEFRVNLKKPEQSGWLDFAAEIVGGSCHFFIEDLEVPVVTFNLFDEQKGLIGFIPRVVGESVWLDNLRVYSIDQHSYLGSPRPQSISKPADNLLTDWEVSGPFADLQSRLNSWHPFAVDERGAVIAAKVTEYLGERRYAYFRTQVTLVTPQILEFATSVQLSLRLNGKEVELSGPNIGRFDFRRVAWFDFREGAQAWIQLPAGSHDVVIEVKSDYAGTGFFARVR
ncbi:MAG: hypothetical protein O7C75_12740, partial [Verrucomicrobia bacterium]|nr:hypothetical protein [Verrucomicrobiota bacterium]